MLHLLYNIIYNICVIIIMLAKIIIKNFLVVININKISQFLLGDKFPFLEISVTTRDMWPKLKILILASFILNLY